MKKNFAISFLLGLFSFQLPAQDKFPFHSLGSFLLQGDTKWLKETFDDQIGGDVKLIGLGEITHGSTEIFQFKAKMVQYLIVEKGFRQILFEYPDASLFLLKRYLLDNNYEDQGILKYLVNQSFRNSIRDASFTTMFRWIKDYNQKHPNDQVSIAGVDLVGAAPSLITYFRTKFHLEPSEAVKLDTVNWKRLPVRAIASKVLNHVHDQERQLKSALGKEWIDFSRLVKNAELELYHDDMSKTNRYAAAKFRDSIMAENTLAMNGVKSVVWAHNLHCTPADLAVSMGNFINKKIGDQYYTILTDFSESANISILDRSGIQYLKLKADKETTANQFWRKKRLADGILFYEDLMKNDLEANVGFIDRNGKYYFTGKGKAFDTLVVFRELSPAK